MKNQGIQITAHVSQDNKIILNYYLNNFNMFCYDVTKGEVSADVKTPKYAELLEYVTVHINRHLPPTKEEALKVLKVLQDKAKALYADKTMERLEERMTKIRNIQEKFRVINTESLQSLCEMPV